MKCSATFVASLVVSLQFLFVVPQVQASAVSMGFDSEVTGGQEPGGPRPWLVSLFDDSVVPGSVRLTLSASGLVDGENISNVYFNLSPGLDPADLTFSFLPALSSGPEPLSIGARSDAFKAANTGKYDIRFDFQKGKGFDAGETVVFDIGGIDGLAATSFDALSKPIGSHDAWLAASHVQNTTGISSGGSGSGWVTPAIAVTDPGPGSNAIPAVPVPAAVWLFVSGLLGLAGFAGKRRSA